MCMIKYDRTCMWQGAMLACTTCSNANSSFCRNCSKQQQRPVGWGSYTYHCTHAPDDCYLSNCDHGHLWRFLKCSEDILCKIQYMYYILPHRCIVIEFGTLAVFLLHVRVIFFEGWKDVEEKVPRIVQD